MLVRPVDSTEETVAATAVVVAAASFLRFRFKVCPWSSQTPSTSPARFAMAVSGGAGAVVVASAPSPATAMPVASAAGAVHVRGMLDEAEADAFAGVVLKKCGRRDLR